VPSYEQEHTPSDKSNTSFPNNESFSNETNTSSQQATKGEYSQPEQAQESGNSPLYSQQPLSSQNTKTPQPERKRAPSLFERFTGAGRQRSQTSSVEEQPVKTQASEEDKEHDVLDIPAFLRRGNQ
jgi:hypothetical protein